MTVQPDERSNQNTRGNDSGMGWRGWKERGAQAYSRGEYAVALQAYSQALHQGDAVPIRDRQLLLSNMVACRLQLGGPAQGEAAVANAKQCIALNDLWAKGHLRLASAYIALGEQASNNDNTTNYSNDACNDDGYDSGYYTGHHHHRSRSFFSSDYLGIFSHGRRGMRSVGHTFFLTAVAYGARRFFGIGPDQILSFVNTLFGRIQGARRR